MKTFDEPELHGHLVLAEDDEDDFEITREAFEKIRPGLQFHRVKDGEELIHFLKGETETPRFIILDLNMPRKDGREALQEIKNDPALKKIPVVVFSTSGNPSDVAQSYDAGAASFVSKPVTLKDYRDIIEAMVLYWMELNTPPKGGAN